MCVRLSNNRTQLGLGAGTPPRRNNALGRDRIVAYILPSEARRNNPPPGQPGAGPRPNNARACGSGFPPPGVVEPPPPPPPPVPGLHVISIAWSKLSDDGNMAGVAEGYDEFGEHQNLFGESFYLSGPGGVTAYAADGVIEAEIYIDGVLVAQSDGPVAGGEGVVACTATIPIP